MSKPEITSVLELSGSEKEWCVHGNWSTICHAAHLTGDPIVIVNNIQYVIAHLLKRHSRMRTRLYIEGYQHILEILNYDQEFFKPNLFYSIRNINDQSWQEIIDNECNRNPYSDNEKYVFPLFHFILVFNQNSEQLSNNNLFHLLLFSNHCVSDGRSGYILINDFLTLVTSSDLYDRIEPLNTQVIPCLSQLTPRTYGPFFTPLAWISKQIYQHELRKLHHPYIPVKAIRLNDKPTKYRFQPIKCNFLFSSSSSTLYSRLHDKCRSQQITLNGPLLACLLLAFHHCFPYEKKHTTNRYLTPFSIGIAVDMRSRLPQLSITSQIVGFYVGLCDIKLKKQFLLHSTPFWTLAKKCTTETNKVLASGIIHFITHFLDYIISNEQKFDRFSQFFPEGLTSELCLSNIGKYPYPCDYNQGQLQLQGLHVVNNNSVYYSTAIFYVSCVGNNQLDFSFTHTMDNDKAQEFFNYYVQLVETCANIDNETTLDQLLKNVSLQ